MDSAKVKFLVPPALTRYCTIGQVWLALDNLILFLVSEPLVGVWIFVSHSSWLWVGSVEFCFFFFTCKFTGFVNSNSFFELRISLYTIISIQKFHFFLSCWDAFYSSWVVVMARSSSTVLERSRWAWWLMLVILIPGSLRQRVAMSSKWVLG